MGNAILRRSKRACALCNAFGEHDHIFVGSSEGSCVTEAYDEFACSRCNDTKTEWLGFNLDNHTGPEETETTITPTCVHVGNLEVTCGACGVKIRDEELPKDYDNHEQPQSNPHEADVIATCVSPGIRHMWCIACNGSWERELPIDTNNHEGPIGYSGDGSPSTCVRHGDREVHCDACGDCWAEELPLDPDNHESWVSGGLQVEGHCEACGATCDHEFYTDSEGYGRCSKCGYWDY